MTNELREAVERLLNEGMGAIDRPLWVAKTVMALAREYLAEHCVDDGEPVTDEWLLTTGWRRCVVLKAITITLPHGGELVRWDHDGRVTGGIDSEWCLPTPMTRGDVRRLCKALGVEVNGLAT